MNLVYRYLRRQCQGEDSEMFWFEYFERLALRYKKLIMKHCKLIDVEEVYSRTCVKKLPLKLQYKSSLPNCTCPRDTFRYKRDEWGNLRSYNDLKCLMCWIDTLERSSTCIDNTQNIPAFLKPKEPTKHKTALLKKKELPKFLK